MGRVDRRSGPSRPRIVLVIGTRPEAIKMAPVALALKAMDDRFETVLCSTGQHKELLTQALEPFGLSPDIDLGLMKAGQSLAALTSRSIPRLDAVYAKLRPDLVMVQGDTATAFAGALAAYYRRIPIAHLEAGLRTGAMYSPFPEEGNRRLISTLAEPAFRSHIMGGDPTDSGRIPISRRACYRQHHHRCLAIYPQTARAGRGCRSRDGGCPDDPRHDAQARELWGPV